MKKIEIKVPDMQSPHCQMRVRSAVQTIKGVQILNVSSGTISINMETDSLQTEVVRAIEKAGYAAGTIVE